MQPGKPARREFEYRRHGVQALLAGLLVHSGKIIGDVYDRNSRLEFVDFLDRLDGQIPAGKEVHAILDNLQVHKTPEVNQWLAEHPRWSFHFTPTHASWLNQIELFFSILTRRLLRRGDLHLQDRPARPAAGLHRPLQPDGDAVRLDLRGEAPLRVNGTCRTRH